MSESHPAASPRKRTKSPRTNLNSNIEDSVMLEAHASQPAFSNTHAPLTPRTSKSVRSPGADGDETEMRLLSEVDGRAHMDMGMDMDEVDTMKVVKKPISTKDKQGMVLLSVLCK
jgi:hypothetical protein